MSEPMSTSSRFLLLSNALHGRGYLDHVEEEIRDFLGAVEKRRV